MARYTGPMTKKSRRLGVDLVGGDMAFERRPFPPGQHGRTRRRNAGSEYLAQLQEKQKAKYIYGVLEKQFKKTYNEANRLQGPTGENLLRLLEHVLVVVGVRVRSVGTVALRPPADLVVVLIRIVLAHGVCECEGVARMVRRRNPSTVRCTCSRVSSSVTVCFVRG